MMIDINELYIVNYRHPNTVPFKNICRLPKEEAFALAHKMAVGNLDTTAFGRFADFENHYPRRMKTDEYLYNRFVSVGGNPKEKHPLSFVLHGSDYLNNWFGNGVVSKIKLEYIPSEAVSFTMGDSGAVLKRADELTMYSKEMLANILKNYESSINDFIAEISKDYHYIEAQLWNDDYCVKAGE